ncbi:oligoendopeptidase F [[Clostridium] sordellii]|uniref:oligoendopeptidase F n=1 Tax=Paraclostridium sordellii TaxID=1505 RepID=UPI0005E911AF|nr:oligoendopeptidase F [Paeniclostridium sordellii]CEO16302.1 oligoendopeptidase F [[Clostridium] sordellii] [Paeniclostridium sordellii]CEP85909.1 oligoendopeptidase F [[Clostridium] sordellii] [Paeniclostridium sordellii]CEQ12544.1 oligoendopeptidase F [[Clostridium] sordellii] [Paeniclostridium sordellii]
MGKNIYKFITIAIVIIVFSSILLVKDIKENSILSSEKTIETMEDKNKEPINKEIKKKTINTSWNLSKLYKNKNDWKSNLKSFNKEIKELENYIGKVTKSNKHLLYALKIKESLDSKIESLYAYVSLNRDINKKSYEFIEMDKEIDKSYKKYDLICSQLEREILSLPDKEYKNLINDKNVFNKYGMYLNDIRRNKDHYLKSDEEKLLSNIGDISQLPKEVYDLFINMDKKSSLNPSQYSTAIESMNRDERKRAFENESVLYNDNINMLSGLFIGQVKKNIFYSDVRGYKNSREMYMSGDDINPKVYDSLINTVNKNLDGLHKYISLRKKVLNIDNIHIYDMHNPIIEPVENNITYERAQEIIYAALNPLGKEYGDVLYKAFNERWIDVYSSDNKVGGAYSLSVYNTHPYILMNYSGNLDSVSTIAHELGHAVYSHMSAKNQNYLNSKPSIFTHEVASVTNEALLYEMLIKNVENKNEKAYYLTQYIDLIKDTLFTQTMYAEFENLIHSKLEKGENINVLVLNDVWGDLLKKYYGKDFHVDQLAKVGWSRIPHFYNSFYVYKYATGCSAAISFSQDILKNGPENYLNFLKKGGSDYPIDLLKQSGINLYSNKPIDQTAEKFNKLVLELEKLIEN